MRRWAQGENMETQKPIAKFRAGSVTCALWENEIRVNGQAEKVLKASVSRRYRDRDGAWKTSTSFSRSEIPLAIYGLQQAFEFMLQQTKSESDGEPLRVDEQTV